MILHVYRSAWWRNQVTIYKWKILSVLSMRWRLVSRENQMGRIIEEEEEQEEEAGDEGGRQHRMGKSGEAYITMASGDDGKQTMTIPLPPVFGQSYVTPERRDRVYQ